MPYHLSLCAPNLLHITLQGLLPLEVAEAFAQDTWQLLDECPTPTSLLFDGRSIQEASNTARRRVEQVLRHPCIGHIAFVVNQQHVPFLTSVVQFAQGIELFGNEQDALRFLHAAQALSCTNDMHQQTASQPARAPALTVSIPLEHPTSEHLASADATHERTQRSPSDSVARTLHCLMDMLDNDMQNIGPTCESSYTSKW